MRGSHDLQLLAAPVRDGDIRRLALGPRLISGLIGCLLVACTVSACGGRETPKAPSRAIAGNIAERFAAAVFRGDAAGARALLVRPDEADLVFLVRQATAPWRRQHASIQLPARRAGSRWVISYVGTRTQRDGGFETQRGDLVVLIAPSAGGARVRFFGLTHVRTSFSTHHDAQLLPSKR